MHKVDWNVNHISCQAGRVVIITGASSGLGAEATSVLASKQADIIMAVRDITKGEAVASQIRGQYPKAKIRVAALDLSSFDSIKTFADDIMATTNRLDLLINNAGVMLSPYQATVDGLELQMGTNHFGHFALTGQLMLLLKRTENSRIVSTSSLAHRKGNIDFDDIHWRQRKYNSAQAYADSKIANLYFTYELARRLTKEPNAPRVTVAHPGWTESDLQRHSGAFRFLNRFFSQGTGIGVLPTLRAAFDTKAAPGDYFGPSNFFEMHGNPIKVASNKRSYNEQSAKALWQLSETVTGVKY